MGSTNKTTNYELSQFVGTDKPSWLGDYNADMSKIDLAIKARAVEAGQAQSSADTANGKADALDTRMDTAEDNILALQNASTTDHAQIATNTGNISKNAQDIVQLDAKIGHTQITIGDHTVTGAIATLASQGGVEADNVSYDNTQSGLTADDVQEAIDELAARPTVADASDVTFDNTGTTLQATNVEDAIKEVATAPASNSNVRYNETTDFLECLLNGSWVQALYLGLKTLIIYLAGVFNYSMSHVSGCVENGYTEFSDARVFQLNQHDMSVPLNALTSTANRMATISTSQSLEITGKKLCFDYYLNGDTTNIQTIKANAVCDANSALTLVAGYNKTDTWFIYLAPVSGTNYAMPTDLLPKLAQISSTSGDITKTDTVHIVKVYCE